MIVNLRLGLREFGWNFNTEASPHDNYCTDSGSKLNDWDVLASLFYYRKKWGENAIFFFFFFTVYGYAISEDISNLLMLMVMVPYRKTNASISI